jgi:hypothetical protein
MSSGALLDPFGDITTLIFASTIKDWWYQQPYVLQHADLSQTANMDSLGLI